MHKLHYIGDGVYVPDAPADDFATIDDAQADRLIATGLYVEVVDPADPDADPADPADANEVSE